MGILKPFFSIIVVSLNPGEKLKKTLASIITQTFKDYEVIIKDGLSSDGSVTRWALENDDERVKIFKETDTGIYEAMNQAVNKASGQFIYFLNCGDLFADEQVLLKAHGEIEKEDKPGIFYGNIFEKTTGQEIFSNPKLNRFACFRNLPCHQACFYKKELLTERPFIVKYKVRADYEHFLWCYLDKKTKTHYIPLLIASYEGTGFSETKANQKLSKLEHKEIVSLYMSKAEIFKYRLILALTFLPLRRGLARNKITAGIYNQLKKLIYVTKRGTK
ncbi:MAG: glycosyltransferase [Lachnospiraceae bacterium]|nr:glycosyltransferase [Lachnospiraceae bacterium]